MNALILGSSKGIGKEIFVSLKKNGIKCKSGIFGEHMELKLNNDGPFTLILNSNK